MFKRSGGSLLKSNKLNGRMTESQMEPDSSFLLNYGVAMCVCVCNTYIFILYLKI